MRRKKRGADSPCSHPHRTDDLAFAYSKTLPVTILYDEAGLQIYDQLITQAADEYYLYNAELSLLREHAREIVPRCFGFETRATAQLRARAPRRSNETLERLAQFEAGFGADGSPIQPKREEEKQKQQKEDGGDGGGGGDGGVPPPAFGQHAPRADGEAKEKWGDGRVGRYNGGVNAEEGLDRALGRRAAALTVGVPDGSAGGKEQGEVEMEAEAQPTLHMIELGAGSLRKSVHLIRALAELPLEGSHDDDSQSGSGEEKKREWKKPGVIYHALDLDKSELIRTLQEIKRTEGDAEQQHDAPTVYGGKVGINGLWATYDQGLEWIGKGGLAQFERAQEDDVGGRKKAAEEGRRCFVWLGSSIGNFDRRGATDFLRAARERAMRPGDTMLIAMDRRNAAAEVALAYNDSRGWTDKFIMNGLRHANRILRGRSDEGGEGEGEDVLDLDKFEYHDRYNEVEGRHESYYRSKVAQVLRIPLSGGSVTEVPLEEGELIHVERSHKYSAREALDTFDGAGLRVVQKWTDESGRYDVWLVEHPGFHFSSSRVFTGQRSDALQGWTQQETHDRRGSHQYDSDGRSGWNGVGPLPQQCHDFGMPTTDDWARMWKAWDTVTLSMIPREMLMEKPIDLRHLCLFYLGHVVSECVWCSFLSQVSREATWRACSHLTLPTPPACHCQPGFTDINIARFFDEPHLNQHFSDIFERGIDPSIESGECTHSHSKVPEKPEDWPKLEEILAYRAAVAQRVYGLYDDFATGKRELNRRAARMVFNVYEHIALHMETLLYMLAQSHKTQPPAGFTTPDWATLARDWDAQDAQQGGEPAREALIRFKSASVTLGHLDDESQDYEYKIHTPSPDVRYLNQQLGSPEFGWDIESPARKVHVAGFSIMAAPINNEQYAKFMQASGITTPPASWVHVGAEGESPGNPLDYFVRTVYGPVSMKAARLWPCQASAAELEAYAEWKGGRLPTQAELRRFLDAEHGPNCTDRPGSNVGFRNWHPVPPQLASRDTDGTVLPAHCGGVWLWTSSPLEPFEGYKPSTLYPGYSSDFFDGKHNVILGGSWATVPSIAGRRSCVNWYQQKYPYGEFRASICRRVTLLTCGYNCCFTVFAGALVAFDK